MKSRTYAIILSCFMLINTGAVNVSAAERNDVGTRYEQSSREYAARLKTIDGLGESRSQIQLLQKRQALCRLADHRRQQILLLLRGRLCCGRCADRG